tara:strand:+ start:440 stop:778 length:339 start_codon:yes stop_codon:yes gene_type:complete
MNSSGWNYDTPTSRPWKLDINTDGTATINTYQNVQPIIEKNKLDLINYGDKLTFGKASGRHTDGVTVASIPTNIWEIWLKETNGAIEKDEKLLAKYLNDPDNKFLRTTPTRI